MRLIARLKWQRLWPLVMVAIVLATIWAVGPASASASSAEWLANEKLIFGLLGAEAAVSLSLEDDKAPFVEKSSVLCKLILDGVVGPEGEGSVELVLNVSKEAVGVLGGLALLGTSSSGPDCVTVTGCAAGTEASPMEVWPVGLPWALLLLLTETKEALLQISKFGYEVLCLTLGINTEDTCTSGEALVSMFNNSEGNAEITNEKMTPNGNCTAGGELSSVNATDERALITLINTELLSIAN